MRRLVDDAGLRQQVIVDSAGTDAWHVGSGADRRAVRVLSDAGYDGSAHRARVVEDNWLPDRDLLIALDRGHLRRLDRTGELQASGRLRLLRSFDPTAPVSADVDDPYDGGHDDFAEVLAQVERACKGLIDDVCALFTVTPTGHGN